MPFLSVLGGMLNIVLDWLFMGILGWGLAGAAIATSIGYAVPSLEKLFSISIRILAIAALVVTAVSYIFGGGVVPIFSLTEFIPAFYAICYTPCKAKKNPLRQLCSGSFLRLLFQVKLLYGF